MTAIRQCSDDSHVYRSNLETKYSRHIKHQRRMGIAAFDFGRNALRFQYNGKAIAKWEDDIAVNGAIRLGRASGQVIGLIIIHAETKHKIHAGGGLGNRIDPEAHAFSVNIDFL